MTRLALPGLVGSALLFLVVTASAACGPSFQVVYEGELRFEHCYALDQMAVSNDARKDCWRDWLRGYTYGQSNDRVEYAATRFSELSLDATLPSEDVSDGGSSRRRSHKPEVTVAAPVPTNAFAPPPNMSAADVRDPPVAATDAGRPRRTMTLQDIPGAECTSSCRDRWDGCRDACKDASCDVCDKAYRTCALACLRDDAGVPKGH